MNNSSKYLVTPALPYANGPCHLGHLVEHVQVNIFVRALRMKQEDVLYVCGADSHGTPIEINAQKAGISPIEFASHWQGSFAKSLTDFAISFDGGFGSTHTKENEAHAGKIYEMLKKKGHIQRREIEQLFDPELKRFLPDRMVRGTCPSCKAKDQYGDSCEACGKTYSPTDLIEPKSVLSGSSPIMKKSEHLFVTLSDFTEDLKTWINKANTIQNDTKAFLDKWFKDGLKDWDISRDGPYFGFLIPGETNKYFYVWLDAPVGYISLSERAAKERGRTVADYWQNPNTKIFHFIGKDIVYFHTLFWPAMLLASGYNLPTEIIVHGMLTVDGEKMSKSRGTFILADTFSKYLSPEALRYYYACKLGRRSEDIDLNLHDFMNRVNTDLVNKVVNLISRTLPLLHRYYEGKPGAIDNSTMPVLEKAKELCQTVSEFYVANEPAKAIHEIVRFSEEGNRYLQEKAPWKIVETNKALAQNIMTTGLYIGKVCFALLKPVLPNSVRLLEEMINDAKPFDFDNIWAPFAPNQQFKEYLHLFKRIESEAINKMIEDSKENQPSKEPLKKEASLIDIDKFMSVDLRAALVIEAKPVDGADKLIACTLDVGDLGRRQVFAGLRPFVEPEYLIGKTVVLVANLAPRKMRFGMSEGMILACGEETPKPIILNGVKPGDRVR